ncbi:MAG TPA: hypothetical protein VH599_05550 [Ktedonobacterales bacterium]
MFHKKLIIVLALAIALNGLALGVLPSSSVAKAASQANPVATSPLPSANTPYTIRWVDLEGHDVKVWHGTYAQALPILQREDAERIKNQPPQTRPDSIGAGPSFVKRPLNDREPR